MKVGTIIQVKFLDHTQSTGGTAEPLEVECIGRLLKETPLYYSIGVWMVGDPDYAQNSDTYCILKSTIIRVKRLS